VFDASLAIGVLGFLALYWLNICKAERYRRAEARGIEAAKQIEERANAKYPIQ